MIEVTVLGSGAAIPMRGQSNCAYLVRTADVRLLIDCGPAILQQLDAIGRTPGDVTHVYLTHRHGDHVLGYPMFLLWWLTETTVPPESFPVTIAGRATWEGLQTLVATSYGELARRTAGAPQSLFPDRESSVIPLPDQVTLRTFPLEHSQFAPVSGVRVEAEGKVVAFTGDTGPCPNISFLARDADLLFHEAALSATLDPDVPDGHHGHSTARSAGANAAAAGVKRLALVHLGSQYEGRRESLVAEAAATFGGEVTAPTAGAIFTL
jgi:ribonuclease Z